MMINQAGTVISFALFWALTPLLSWPILVEQEPSPSARSDHDRDAPSVDLAAAAAAMRGTSSETQMYSSDSEREQAELEEAMRRSADDTTMPAGQQRPSARDSPPPIEGLQQEAGGGAAKPVPLRRRPRHVSVNLGQVTARGHDSHDDPHRIILVPPGTTDSQLKALLHAWCSHDAAAGYMIVLSSTLPGADDFDWGKFEEMPFTISLRSERLIYDMRLLPGCVCLTAGSAQQLQRHRQDFEREANHGEFRTERESALVDAVCIKKEKDVAFDKSKQLQNQLHSIALQIAGQLFDRAVAISENAVEEMCDWAMVGGDWMMAISYCKAVGRFSLTEDEMTRLVNMGRSAAVKHDELYNKLKEEKRRLRKQEEAVQRMGNTVGIGMGLRRWRKKAKKPERTGSLPKAVGGGGISQMRRRSLNSAVDHINLSLAGMLDDEDSEETSESDGAETPPVDYFGRAQVAARFATPRAERAWRATHHVPRQDLPPDRVGPSDAPGGEAAVLLDRVRDEIGEGKEEGAISTIIDEFAAKHLSGGAKGGASGRGGNTQDPLSVRDAKLLTNRVIGQLGEQPQLPSPRGVVGNAPQSPGRLPSGEDDVDERDEKSVFTEK
jgi:hypothetical protein